MELGIQSNTFMLFPRNSVQISMWQWTQARVECEGTRLRNREPTLISLIWWKTKQNPELFLSSPQTLAQKNTTWKVRGDLVQHISPRVFIVMRTGKLILKSNRKDWLQAGEMAQGINALAVMPNNLSSTPRAHMVDPKSCPLSFTKVSGHTHAPYIFF